MTTPPRTGVAASPHVTSHSAMLGPAAQTAEVVAAGLGVDPARGLSAVEATERARTAGPNELAHVRRRGLPEIVLEAVREPFILVLAAAGMLAVLLGEVRDGLLILVALVPIVSADILTEYRGERALDALRAASAPVARVRRDGAAADVPAIGLVAGDIVLLKAGDVVPADVRLVVADRLVIDRSVLTGESVPEPAAVAPDAAGAPLGDIRALAQAGTSVVGGRGEGIVVAIGGATEVGRIAARLERLVRFMLYVALGLIAVVMALGFARGDALGKNVLAGISAAIAAIPEEPPVLVAVVLGLGAYRLLKRGVLVRRLNAEEVLGAVDLIITDKTGTLTRNRLAVADVVEAAGPVADPDRRRELLLLALRAEEDAWVQGSGVRPGSFTRALTDGLTEAGGDATLDPADLLEGEPVTDGRPISTTRSRRDGVVEELVVGAPEHVLGLAGEVAPAWLERLDEGTRAGQRLVALARRTGEAWEILALVAFADPLRDGISGALAETAAAGIQTVVVTGDHPATAAAIAGAAGLKFERVVTGPELAAWSDDQLRAELPNLHIVARSTPEQKERIVWIARAAGRIVAVTGDGVNDAPALNGADVAVAMGSGTAVAREAADLVLGDDSFLTLTYGLAEGRRLVDNIQKGLVFLVSTHVALLGYILLASLGGVTQPLLPIQILWMELFIDIAASVAFEREPSEPDLMRRPPRKSGKPLLPLSIFAKIGVSGGVSALAALWLAIGDPAGGDHSRWLAYTVLVCAQVVRAYANRSLRTPLHRMGQNGMLLGAALVAVGIQVLIPLVAPLADAFRASPLTLTEWGLVALIALAPALVAEVARTVRQSTWVA